MGNRAIVKPEGKNIGVYLHWNGGPDSVRAFLKYCELKEFRPFDDSYGMARFCQVVGNFFGGTLSLGIDDDVRETKSYADGLDNGIYVVKGWDVTRRIGGHYDTEGYKLEDMLKSIDIKQPIEEQLGEEFLDAKEVLVSEIEVGDFVFVRDIREKVKKYEVIGIGEDEVINGNNVLGIPFIDLYSNGKNNPNNFIHGDKVRVVRKGDIK